MAGTHTEAVGDRPVADRSTGAGLLVLGVLLLSINLRPTAVGLAPILTDLRDRLGLSTVEMALLPTLPILCFGLFAPAGPPLRRWLGEERTLGLALVAILIGLSARAAAPGVALFAGTILACAAIGVANVLTPSLIKRRVPFRAGLMAGLYTTTLSLGGSLGTGLTVPFMEANGNSINAALWLWAFPVVLGVAAWAPQLRYGRLPAPPEENVNGSGWRVLLRSPLAWHVTLFMGLQSLLFYTIVGWLPTMLRSEGYTPEHAGFVTTLINIVGPVGSMLAPVIAARGRDQRPVLLSAIGMATVGIVGLLVSPTGVLGLVASVVLGVGIGSVFALAILLFLLRSADSRTAALLSSMAQTLGYVIAAAGPFAFGLLHDATNGWTIPMYMLLALVLAQIPLALSAGRNRQIQA